MKLQLIAALAGPFLRSIGQRDLADKLADAVEDFAREMVAIKARQDRLEEKYQQIGKDVERMLRARGIADQAPDDYERRLTKVEAQVKEWQEADEEEGSEDPF